MYSRPENTSWPTFLVIGAMRAGTTSLYYDLMEHPDVSMATVKEPNFFALEAGETDLPLTPDAISRMLRESVIDRASYELLFEGSPAAAARGDVSPAYLYSKAAARRIAQAAPSSRLIAILRNPVDRAYSAYLRRSGVEPTPEAFLEVAMREWEIIEQGGLLPLYPLIQGSLYSRHLDAYTRLFEPSQLAVRIYEEFWPTYPRSLESILDHIGVGRVLPAASRSLNQSGVPRSPRLDRLLRGGGSLKETIKRRFPDRAVRSLVGLKQAIEDWTMSDAPAMTAPIRSLLMNRFFLDDIKRTEDMLGLDLSIWRRASDS